MNSEDQKSSLATALETCRKLQYTEPEQVFLLASEGRNHRYSIIDLTNKADRQRLLENLSTHIRATITPTCLTDAITDQLLDELHNELDSAYTPYGKSYNAYDLGDFLNRARERLSAKA